MYDSTICHLPSRRASKTVGSPNVCWKLGISNILPPDEKVKGGDLDLILSHSNYNAGSGDGLEKTLGQEIHFRFNDQYHGSSNAKGGSRRRCRDCSISNGYGELICLPGLQCQHLLRLVCNTRGERTTRS